MKVNDIEVENISFYCTLYLSEKLRSIYNSTISDCVKYAQKAHNITLSQAQEILTFNNVKRNLKLLEKISINRGIVYE